uniref:Uncharacterized protein n=1 Tax=Leersia perrieri TaxID=77586 RepID=A0A0D9V4J4_9ORYZ
MDINVGAMHQNRQQDQTLLPILPMLAINFTVFSLLPFLADGFHIGNIEARSTCWTMPNALSGSVWSHGCPDMLLENGARVEGADMNGYQVIFGSDVHVDICTLTLQKQSLQWGKLSDINRRAA